MTKEQAKIQKYALEYKVPVKMIEVMVRTRNISPKKAAQIISRIIIRDRESKFEW